MAAADPYDAAMSGQKADPYDSAMGGAAASNIVGTQGTSPTNAADALRLGPKVGVPPASIMGDPTQAKGMDTIRNAVSISNTNPDMKRWASGDPAHVAASADQFDFLDGLSKAFTALKQSLFVQPGEQPREEGFGAEYGREAMALLTSITGAHGYSSKAALDAYAAGHPNDPLTKAYLADPASVIAKSSSGLFGDLAAKGSAALQSLVQAPFALSGIQPALTAGPGSWLESATGLRRDITGNVLTLLLPLAKTPLKAMADFIPKPEAKIPPAGLDQPGTVEGTFREVKPGEAEVADAEHNASTVDAFHQVIQESELQARSPETMGEFIKQVTENTPIASMKINAQQVVDAYQKSGTLPHDKDGILGWVPDLNEQMTRALAHGGDIEVPTDGYMTNVSDAGHAALREGLSFADAPSLREANEIKPVETSVETGEKEGAPTGATEISPAIKAAVDKAKTEAYLSPLFTDAKSAGMTEGQFNLYSKRISDADTAIYSKMQDLVTKQIERERGAEWQTRAKAIEPEVRAELGSRPEYAARHFLATGELPDGRKPSIGPVKLDRSVVAAQHPNLVGSMPKAIFGPNGVGADDLAEMFGFRNGESLLASIHNTESLRALAEQATGKKLSIPQHFEHVVRLETARRVNGELGDFLSPESIDAEARAAVQVPEVQRLLTDELQALAKAAGLPFDKGKIAGLAEKTFEGLQVKDARNIKALERLVGRNGREAEVALLKGKFAEAFKAKQAQLINNHMLEMAHDFNKELTRYGKNVANWRSSPTIKNIDQDYMDRIHEALVAMDYRVARNYDELASAIKDKSLESFINDKNLEGDEIVYSPITKGVKPTELTVGAFRDANDFLTSLAANGKRAQEIVTHAGRTELADAVNRASDQFEDRPDKKTLGDLIDNSPTYTGMRKRFTAAFQDFVANARVIEFMVDDLDASKGIHGIYNEAAMRPMQDAFNERSTELRAFAQHLAKYTDNASESWRKNLDQEIEVNLPFKDLHGESITPIGTKKNLLTAALYYGSASGRDKLLQGFGWNEVHERGLLDAFEKYLNDDDRKWLEHMWDWGKLQYPKVESFTRRVSGVASAPVMPLPFDVQGKTLSGGYAPIVYDKDLTPFANRNQPGGNATDMFGKGYVRATTPRGYTKARTGYVGPLDLDPSHLYTKYLQEIHDMTMREALVSAQRFLTNQKVGAVIRKSLGNGYYKQIQPWLNRVAGSMNTNENELGQVGRLTELGRHMIISSNLAYHISTVWIHGTTAGAKSLQDLGWKGLNRAISLYNNDPAAFVKFNRDNSEFLRDRKVDRDETHQEQFDRMTKNQGKVSKWVQQAQDIGFSLLRASDNISAHVQWRGAYEQAMADPNIANHDDAVYFADKAVRTAHGSGREIDLPQLLGSKSPWLRSFTGFMTSRINSVNRIWSSKNWQQLLVNFLATVGVSAAAYTAIHHDEKHGLMHQLLWNGVAEGLGYLPLVGGMVYAVQHKDKVQASLIDDMLQIGVDNISDWEKLTEGKHAPIVQDTLRALGSVTGGVAGAAARPAQYWTDVATGYRPQPTFGEGLRATLLGPPPRKAN